MSRTKYSRRMLRGQLPRISDAQLLSALRSGRLSPLPSPPAYTLDFLQQLRGLKKRQTKARMNENIRREAFLMSDSAGW